MVASPTPSATPSGGSQRDLVTAPGAVFFLPHEAPQQTAAVIATALSQAT